MPKQTLKTRRADKTQDTKQRQREGRERLSERDEDDVPQETYRDGSVYEEPPRPQRKTARKRSLPREAKPASKK